MDGQDHANVLLAQLLDTRAAEHGQRLAYRFLRKGESDEQTLTYAELRDQAHGLAAELTQSVGRGQRALLLYPPGLEFVKAFFACLASGVIAVPLPLPRRNERTDRLRHVLRDAQPKAILTNLESKELVESALPEGASASLLVSDSLAHSQLKKLPEHTLALREIAFLQYTSGSTGAPKGVVVSHANLVANLRQIQECFGHTRESSGVIWLPHYHDMGLIGGILQPFFVGFEVTLFSPLAFVQSPGRWLRAIDRYRATTSGGPNFAYELCAERAKEPSQPLDLSSWSVAFTGAEAVRPRTMRRFYERFARYGFRREAILPCYGLAEATLLVTAVPKNVGLRTIEREALERPAASDATEPHPTERNPSEASPAEPHAAKRPMESKIDERQAEFVSSGVVARGTRLRIEDVGTGRPCPDGVVGEILISGPSVTRGYWHELAPAGSAAQEARTQERHGGLPVGLPAPDRPEPEQTGSREQPAGERYLRTGDLGFSLGGELFVTGRLKDLIIIRGVNLFPDDVEEVVRNVHPLLRNEGCVAFSIDCSDTEVLTVLLEMNLRSARQLNMESIRADVERAILERFGVTLGDFVAVRSGGLARTSSGKLSRSLNRDLFLTSALPRMDFGQVAQEQAL